MMEAAVRAFREYMRLQGLLPREAGAEPLRILCACSGGTDSIALLHLLWETEGIVPVAAHFNHSLRGAESDRDALFVRSQAEALGVEFCLAKEDVAAFAAGERLGIEEAARTLRYRFLGRAATERHCPWIATAHTADDNAETVLLHLLRGSGTRGLCGIPPVRENILRPLLNVTREELEAFLDARGLDHVEDSSNREDDYARNRLRHAVLPVLRELNTGAVKNICSAAALLRQDEDYFDTLAADFLERQPEEQTISVSGLLALPRPAAMRVLRRFCGRAGRGHYDAVYALCAAAAPRGSLDLPGARISREYDLLRRGTGMAPAQTRLPRREVRPGEALPLPEIGKTVRCRQVIFAPEQEIYSSFNTFYFQCGKICGKINIASRAPGDAIRLAGRGCTKQVRKLFSEQGLSLAERERTPVLSDEAGVIAVQGFGVAERCVPAAGEPAYEITIEEWEN